MKTQLKFRFWEHDNEGNGIMYSFDEIKKFDNPQLTLGDFILYPNNNKNIILMQFTGLTDKNGKEIYEGDIVKDKEPFEILFCKVVYIAPCYWLMNIPDDRKGKPAWELQDYEVIGNIYENPELLK